MYATDVSTRPTSEKRKEAYYFLCIVTEPLSHMYHYNTDRIIETLRYYFLSRDRYMFNLDCLLCKTLIYHAKCHRRLRWDCDRTAVSLSKALYPLLSGSSTQGDPPWHDWNIIDWVVKNQTKAKQQQISHSLLSKAFKAMNMCMHPNRLINM